MARGLYRWSEDSEGVDKWWVRIDRGSGDWDTLSEEQYIAEGMAPDFLELPLRDDHLSSWIGSTLGGG